jgi:hypothetical protein
MFQKEKIIKNFCERIFSFIMKTNNEFEISLNKLFSFECKERNILNKLNYVWYGQNQLKMKLFRPLTQIKNIY